MKTADLRTGRRRSGGSRRLVETPEEWIDGVALQAPVAGLLLPAGRPDRVPHGMERLDMPLLVRVRGLAVLRGS